MLQIIRDKTAGVVFKVLFLFLVVSFAVWGIGDYRFLQRKETPIVTVGGEALPLEMLRMEFQRDVTRLRQGGLGEIDRDVLRQIGLAKQTVERVTNQAVLDRTTGKLNLVVSDQVVRQRIQEDPNFKIGGTFDATTFKRTLQENGFSEARFVELMRVDAARSALIESVTLGAGAPPALAEQLYRYREEKRRAEILFVPAAGMPDPGQPTDADLKASYESNADRFTDPEFRSGAVIRIGFDEIRGAIQIDDAQVQAEFEARRREFAVPEFRTIEVIRFDDEAAATAAKAKLDGGAAFLDIAQEAGQSPEQVKIFGRTTATSLPADLATPIFALALESPSAPIVTPLGVFIARITAIEGGVDPSFESLRARLAEELARRTAGELAYRTATRIEESINEGKSLQDAAAAANVPVIALDAVDSAGRGRDGQPLAVFANAPEALRAFSEGAVGRDSGLIETRAGSFFFARVDAVTPSQRRALDAVKAEVAAVWRQEQLDASAQKRADEIVAKVKAGASLADAGEAFGLKPQALEPMRRDGTMGTTASRAPAPIAARLFQLKTNEIASTSAGDGHVVVRLAEIIAADPAADVAGVKRLTSGLGEQIAVELSQQYVRALRNRLNVVIDEPAIDGLYQN